MPLSFLVICWLGSILVLVGIFLYACTRTSTSISENVPGSFKDFVAIEMVRTSGELLHGLAQARPHGERAFAEGVMLFQRGHAMFIEKVFGRLEIEKGKAGSFFLKRIAENKESLRGEKDKTIVE